MARASGLAELQLWEYTDEEFENAIRAAFDTSDAPSPHDFHELMTAAEARLRSHNFAAALTVEDGVSESGSGSNSGGARQQGALLAAAQEAAAHTWNCPGSPNTAQSRVQGALQKYKVQDPKGQLARAMRELNPDQLQLAAAFMAAFTAMMTAMVAVLAKEGYLQGGDSRHR